MPVRKAPKAIRTQDVFFPCKKDPELDCTLARQNMQPLEGVGRSRLPHAKQINCLHVVTGGSFRIESETSRFESENEL